MKHFRPICLTFGTHHEAFPSQCLTIGTHHEAFPSHFLTFGTHHEAFPSQCLTIGTHICVSWEDAASAQHLYLTAQNTTNSRIAESNNILLLRGAPVQHETMLRRRVQSVATCRILNGSRSFCAGVLRFFRNPYWAIDHFNLYLRYRQQQRSLHFYQRHFALHYLFSRCRSLD